MDHFILNSSPGDGGVSAWSWPLGGPLLFLSFFHSDKTVVKTDTYSWLAVAFVLLKEVNPQMNLLCKAKNHFSFPPPFFGIYSVGFYCLLLILIFYTFCAQNRTHRQPLSPLMLSTTMWCHFIFMPRDSYNASRFWLLSL